MSVTDQREQETREALARLPVKQVFLNCVIIPQMTYVDRNLRDYPRGTYAALIAMIGLISDLDPMDRDEPRIKDANAKLGEIWERGLRHTGTSFTQLLDIWRLITAHLHIWYFREMGVRAFNPHPKPIHREEDQQEPAQNENPKRIG